jgi:hypothetical protein
MMITKSEQTYLKKRNYEKGTPIHFKDEKVHSNYKRHFFLTFDTRYIEYYR